MTNGKMYKVLVPIERDGNKHWVRLGTGFTNKDESINCYVDSLPITVFTGKEMTIQLREYTQEDMRRRDEFRANKNSGNGGGGGNGHLRYDDPPLSPMEGRGGDPPF